MHVERKPIYINDKTVLLISEYRRHNDEWDLYFLDDSMKNYRGDVKLAAKNLVDAIADSSSIRFLQCLRQAIANQIDEHNKQFGSSHGYDLLEAEK